MRLLFGIITLTLCFYCTVALAQECPEFSELRSRITSGGPPKDGIPSIDEPQYLEAGEADIDPGARVAGVAHGELVAAYPLAIMNWHEIVNDSVDGKRISLTYCPLTRSALGFLGYEFGVSGQLYNNNLVMYDRATDSYVPQLLGEGVSGPLCGVEPERVPMLLTTWEQWRAAHPRTRVLSRMTGHGRNYERNPYLEYEQSDAIIFPVTSESDRLPNHEQVLAVEVGEAAAAVQVAGFAERHPQGLTARVGVAEVRFTWDGRLGTVTAASQTQGMISYPVYWFAFHAFHPEGELLSP